MKRAAERLIAALLAVLLAFSAFAGSITGAAIDQTARAAAALADTHATTAAAAALTAHNEAIAASGVAATASTNASAALSGSANDSTARAAASAASGVAATASTNASAALSGSANDSTARTAAGAAQTTANTAVSNAAAAQSTANSALSGGLSGRSISDVSASRSIGTIYTNSSSQWRFVQVVVGSNYTIGSAFVYVTVAGIAYGAIQTNESNGSQFVSHNTFISFWVPPNGGQYLIQGATSVVISWVETI